MLSPRFAGFLTFLAEGEIDLGEVGVGLAADVDLAVDLDGRALVEIVARGAADAVGEVGVGLRDGAERPGVLDAGVAAAGEVQAADVCVRRVRGDVAADGDAGVEALKRPWREGGVVV